MIMHDIEMPEGHGPKEWVVVNNSPLIVSAGCICGNDDCGFTVTAYNAVNINLEPIYNVRLK